MIKTHVLRNKRFQIVLPKMPDASASMVADSYRRIYSKELKYAQLTKRYVTTWQYLMATILEERGVQ